MQSKPDTYSVLRRLGASGTSEVLLAAQRDSAGELSLIVVKRLLSRMLEVAQFTQAFEKHARRALTLQHENIVRVYEVRRDERALCLAMEYLSGEDLGFVIGQLQAGKIRMPVNIACAVMAQAAAGLQYVHSATDGHGKALHMLHWDLTPRNVMVSYSGVCKLLNVGLARADAQDMYGVPGSLRRELAYRAPERIQHGRVDQRSDVFSLGVQLYELLAGRRLFVGDNEAGVVKSVMERKVAPPSRFCPEVPVELDELVLKAIHRDRTKRVQSAQELRDGLERILTASSSPVDVRAVGRWLQGAFGERFAERRQVERQALAEALGPVRSSAATLDVPLLFDPTQPLPASQVSRVNQNNVNASGRLPNGLIVPGRRAALLGLGGSRIWPIAVITSLATLLLASALGFSYWLGRASPSASAHPEASDAALWVHVLPAGSRLLVDGRVKSEALDASGVLIPVVPSRDVTLNVSKPGYVAQTAVIRAPRSATKEVHISLSMVPGRHDAPRTTVAPATGAVGAVSAHVERRQSTPLGQWVALVLLPLIGVVVGAAFGAFVSYRRIGARKRGASGAAAVDDADTLRISSVPGTLGDDMSPYDLQQALKRAESEAMKAQRELAVSRGETEQVRTRVTRLEKELSEVRTELSDSRGQRVRIEAQLDVERGQLANARRQLHAVAAQLSEARGIVGELEQELSVARARADRATGRGYAVAPPTREPASRAPAVSAAPSVSVNDALDRDPKLMAQQREVIRNMYQQFIANGGKSEPKSK